MYVCIYAYIYIYTYVFLLYTHMVVHTNVHADHGRDIYVSSSFRIDGCVFVGVNCVSCYGFST